MGNETLHRIYSWFLRFCFFIHRNQTSLTIIISLHNINVWAFEIFIEPKCHSKKSENLLSDLKIMKKILLIEGKKTVVRVILHWRGHSRIWKSQENYLSDKIEILFTLFFMVIMFGWGFNPSLVNILMRNLLLHSAAYLTKTYWW